MFEAEADVESLDVHTAACVRKVIDRDPRGQVGHEEQEGMRLVHIEDEGADDDTAAVQLLGGGVERRLERRLGDWRRVGVQR